MRDEPRLSDWPERFHDMKLPELKPFTFQPHIEICVYKPDPARPDPVDGYQYQVLDYRRKVQDILDELNAKLTLEGLEIDDGFTNMTKYDDPAYKTHIYSAVDLTTGPLRLTVEWPEYRRICVYPVTGGSEGHYVHIATIADAGRLRPTYTAIGLAKTFLGWDFACRISASAARLLQA